MAVYEGFTVYGPYTRKDGRQLVVLTKHNTNGCIIERHTVSYPKYIVEKHINRYLLPNETVDHIDCNFRNNDLSNLRIIDRKVHCKSHTSSKLIIVKQCAICDTLYNAGYRVVPDGAVILTPEERDEEMKEINKTLAERDELKAEIVKLKSKIEELKLKCAALFPKGKHPSE